MNVEGEEETYPPNFLGSLRHEKHIFHHYEDNHDNMERLFANATLNASPSTIANGGTVQVQWKGITGATSDDWIAIFCGEGGSDQNYLDYLSANGYPEGSVWFQGLINLRCDYSFRYYHGTLNKEGRYPLAAISNKVTMKGGNGEPTQIHISRTENATQMGITWISGSNQTEGVVEYGLSPYKLNLRSTTSLANTYKATDMCGSQANITSQQLFRDPGYIHSLLLDNLSANTKYYYRVGNEEEGFSEITWFLSAQSTDEKSTKIVMYGDMGVWPPPSSLTTAERVAAEVEENGFQLILHIGDISYARGYSYIWDQFFSVIQPIAAHIPYMINMGNHEYDHTTTNGQNDPSGASGTGFHPIWGDYGDDSNGECSVPPFYRFPSQVFPSNGNGIYWYSFNNGPVHVIMMSTEHNYTKGSEQYDWIENDLKGVNRSETPFVIFGGHRAMYCSEILYLRDFQVQLGMRVSFESLLFSYHVDLAVWGHHHTYERTCPVYKGECNDEGTTHIVVGTAGAGLDDPSAHLNVKWSTKYIVEYGYLTVEVNENQMTCKFILNTTGEIADQFTLISRF